MYYYRSENGTEPEQMEASHTEHTVEEDTFTHFSTFALSAKDGSTRWHHLPGEFGEQETKKEVDQSNDNLKFCI
jgi:hypothetical protein